MLLLKLYVKNIRYKTLTKRIVIKAQQELLYCKYKHNLYCNFNHNYFNYRNPMDDVIKCMLAAARSEYFDAVKNILRWYLDLSSSDLKDNDLFKRVWNDGISNVLRTAMEEGLSTIFEVQIDKYFIIIILHSYCTCIIPQGILLLWMPKVSPKNEG